MPRIPTYQADTRALTRDLPISPAAASAPYTAMAKVGERISDVASYGAQVWGAIKKAERTVKAAEIESQMKNDIDDAALSFKMRTDFEKFDEDADRIVKGLQGKYADIAGDDQTLKEAVDRAFIDKSRDFVRTITAKKIEQITNRGQGQLQNLINQSYKDYAATTTGEERQLIMDKIGITIKSFADSNIIKPKDAEIMYQAFTNTAEAVRADQITEVDPETALKLLKGGAFNLDPKTRQRKITQASTHIRTLETQRLAQEARDERKREKIRKETIDRNDIDQWRAYFNGSLNVATLEKLASNQMISESAYKGIREKLLKGDKEENNPIVVAEIATQVELRDFDGAKESLAKALSSGQIKTETYVHLRTAMASKSYGDAASYINGAMQPSEIETDFYIKQKFADAHADLAIRTASGEDPIVAAKDIVQLYRKSQVMKLGRLRLPRFLEGKKDDPAALNKATVNTSAALNSGKITEREFLAEIELIENIRKAIADSERTKAAQEQIDKAMKDQKVGK